MKSLIIAASALTLSAAAAAPALAQTWAPNSYYGSLGYTYVQPDHGSFSELNGRLGARWGSFLGVEGEMGAAISNLGRTTPTGTALRVGEPIAGAGYGVVYYPVAPNIELLARLGYGEANFHTTNETNALLDSSRTWGSLNYGVGAQYFVDGKNGIRVDYTRRDYQGTRAPTAADTAEVSYVRKF